MLKFTDCVNFYAYFMSAVVMFYTLPSAFLSHITCCQNKIALFLAYNSILLASTVNLGGAFIEPCRQDKPTKSLSKLFVPIIIDQSFVGTALTYGILLNNKKLTIFAGLYVFVFACILYFYVCMYGISCSAFQLQLVLPIIYNVWWSANNKPQRKTFVINCCLLLACV